MAPLIPDAVPKNTPALCLVATEVMVGVPRQLKAKLRSMWVAPLNPDPEPILIATPRSMQVTLGEPEVLDGALQHPTVDGSFNFRPRAPEIIQRPPYPRFLVNRFL